MRQEEKKRDDKEKKKRERQEPFKAWVLRSHYQLQGGSLDHRDGTCCQSNFDFYLSVLQVLLGIFHCIFYQNRRKILLVQLENDSKYPAVPQYDAQTSCYRKTVTTPTTAMAKKLAIVPLFLRDREGAMVHD